MIEKYPLVSVIIPVYNRGEIFKRSFESASQQTYPNLEIIIVDDGSSPAISLPPEATEKIKLIRQENRGAPAARNRGFAESKGEYIIFWDADLIALPEMIAKLVNILQENPPSSYAYCDFKFGKKKLKFGPFDPEKLRRINYITTSSLLRREDFCGFDIALKKFQDWDLWLTLLSNNKTGVYLPECLFTVVPGGTMSTWLPRFAYWPLFSWLPFVRERVKQYQVARQVIVQKHHLPG